MKKILIAVSGGIAACKSHEVGRLLQQRGAEVRYLLSEHAAALVQPATLQALSGAPVRVALFDAAAEAAMSHIELARWADLFLVCPATANTMAKMAQGIADNLLTTVYLATDAEVVLAPAMNRLMWQHPATQDNVARLAARPRHRVLSPAEGLQACGEYGTGRLPEPEAIVEALLGTPAAQGLRIAITAGPTREAIDPVRYLSNHSSGKMGYALAAAAQQMGAEVSLITGPTALTPPFGVTVIPVVTACEMARAALSLAPQVAMFIAAAAVCDYRLAAPKSQKHKKREDGPLRLELVENPDIVAAVSALPAAQRPFTVGFAAETEQVLAHARAKRARKNLDAIIANDVSGEVFASDDNAVTLITRTQERFFPRTSKKILATQLLHALLAARSCC